MRTLLTALLKERWWAAILVIGLLLLLVVLTALQMAQYASPFEYAQ